ncbi:MAG: bifunctional metallophosphatase/5'-nucleotidase [Lachnospiraceae bacterium]|nr:bifunctional metallophosphatase/5'-nucleotidase [Lachnospiraceae bacterium]
MKKSLLKITALLISSVLLLSACGNAAAPAVDQSAKATTSAEETSEGSAPADATQASETTATQTTDPESSDAKDIVVVFTNDVHCGVDDAIGYAGLSAYKKKMESEGNDVLLIDAGDAVQGGFIGMLSKGEAIIRLMNKVGYDMAIPGNHEFDYGMEQFLKFSKIAEFPYISCNLTDLKTQEKLFDPYIIFEAGGKKIAFVGATTPSSLTSSNPANFQDENGEYIYGFCQGDNGKLLYKTVQDAVDSARAEGADYCVLVCHLGIEATEAPYMSTDVIKNTHGIDVVCDGHSHSVIEGEPVKNDKGEIVLLAQTGTKLSKLGQLTIHPDGTMETVLVEDFTEKDPEITAAIAEENAKFEDIVGRKISHTDFDLIASTEEGGWIIRNNETNLGDLFSDAIKEASGAEIGLINGGGVRKNLLKGDITYGNLLDLSPLGNEISVMKMKGQVLLDALEFSVSFFPEDFGGFLQVSGVTFDVDLSKDAGVKKDADNMFEAFTSDERRVNNVKVNGVPLDPDKEYTVAGPDFTLFSGGDGFTMFEGEKIETGKQLIDIDVIEEYLNSFNGNVPEEYAESQERIHYVE